MLPDEGFGVVSLHRNLNGCGLIIDEGVPYKLRFGFGHSNMCGRGLGAIVAACGCVVPYNLLSLLVGVAYWKRIAKEMDSIGG